MKPRPALLLAAWLVRPALGDDEARCGVLDAAGRVRAGAGYNWTLHSLVVDTAAGPATTVRFLLSSPLLTPRPALCWATTRPSDAGAFQSCTNFNETPLQDPWVSFSYGVPRDGFVQVRQTWTCDRAGNK